MKKDKVQSVRDWPTPADQHQLKNFLGLASFYRRFVRASCVWQHLFSACCTARTVLVALGYAVKGIVSSWPWLAIYPGH